MRLIDADSIPWFVDGVGDIPVVTKEEIDNMPTVDAVPVIRCKNCKHWDGYYCHNKWWGDGYGNYTPPIKTEKGFCDWVDRKAERTFYESLAERKEN